MAKNANGDGSIYQLKSGKWQAAITVNGKRRTRTRDSRKEARDALRELQREAESTGNISSSPTVAEYAEVWQQENEVRKLAPNTIQVYANLLSNHILPRIGRRKLHELTPVEVQSMVNDMVNDGVGVPTVGMAGKTLSTMFRRAIQMELCSTNPCVNVRKPERGKVKIEFFSVEEAKRIIEYGESKRYPGLWKLAFQTGMRYGELTGLHWSEVDFDAGQVHVIQQLTYGRYRGLRKPKTESGVRTIQVSDEVLESLNQQRRRNMRDGNGRSPHVFCNPSGGFIWIQVFYKCHWSPMLRKLEIPHRGFHAIRHTYATLAISEGVPITTVSQILGHANASITLQKYAHAVPQDQSKAVATMQRLFA